MNSTRWKKKGGAPTSEGPKGVGPDEATASFLQQISQMANEFIETPGGRLSKEALFGLVPGIIIGCVLLYLGASLESSGAVSFVVAILLITIKMMLDIKSWHFKLDRYLNSEREGWETFTRKTELVLKVNLSESFSQVHINKLSKMLDAGLPLPAGESATADVTPQCICAVDATSPFHWWSSSMLGYLAVQAAWCGQAARAGSRSIQRLFIVHPYDLDNPLGRKMIVLHRLMGFDTYVTTMRTYSDIFKEEMSGHLGSTCSMLRKREFVVFDGCATDVALSDKGYQSYWDVTTPDSKRETDKHNIKFARFETDEESTCYLQLFKRVCSQATDCYAADDIASAIDDASDGADTRLILKLCTEDSDVIESVLVAFGTYESEVSETGDKEA